MASRALFPSTHVILSSSNVRIVEWENRACFKWKSSVVGRKGNRQISVMATLSDRWREIQGSKNWDGILKPLDLDLRKEIIRYGELTTASNDNFDDEPTSRYLGSTYFPKSTFFDKAGLHGVGYEVTRFVYSSIKSVEFPGFVVKIVTGDPVAKESNWMGYVAVATDPALIKRLGRRDIAIAFRGTRKKLEWLELADVNLIDKPAMSTVKTPKGVQVESGFWHMLADNDVNSTFNKTCALQQVIDELKRLIALYPGEQLSITVVGHSLGAALANLSSYEIALQGINKIPSSQRSIPITNFTWGGPRCGNDAFRDSFNDLGLKCLRVVNVQDVVPKVPTADGLALYRHVGVKLEVDYTKSPYLQPNNTDIGNFHNLEMYLHLVDGFQNGNSFALVTDRDIALVNKSAAILKPEFKVPGTWWQQQNKGLVQNSAGRWVEAERFDMRHPSPSFV